MNSCIEVECSICKRHIGYMEVPNLISESGDHVNSISSGEDLISFMCDKCKKEKESDDLSIK